MWHRAHGFPAFIRPQNPRSCALRSEGNANEKGAAGCCIKGTTLRGDSGVERGVVRVLQSNLIYVWLERTSPEEEELFKRLTSSDQERGPDDVDRGRGPMLREGWAIENKGWEVTEAGGDFNRFERYASRTFSVGCGLLWDDSCELSCFLFFRVCLLHKFHCYHALNRVGIFKSILSFYIFNIVKMISKTRDRIL